MKGKTPPHSLEAEELLLGTILRCPESAPIALAIIKPEDCYQPKHKVILKAIYDAHLKGLCPDLTTIASQLRNQDDSFDYAWLASLTDCIPFTGRVEQYAHIIKKHSLARFQIKQFAAATDQLYRGCDPEQVSSDHITILSKSMSEGQGQASHIREITGPVISEAEAASSGKFKHQGVSSGFENIDRLTCGFRPGELILVAARPSMGKTALSVNFARSASLSGHTVLFFSLEMSRQALVSRMLCDLADISASDLRAGTLTPDSLKRLRNQKEIIDCLPIIIDDRASLRTNQIESRSAQVAAKYKLGLVIIDYLQLCRAEADSRYLEIGEISRSLKAIAKKFEVPVIALSQLSRDIEKRQDPKPRLSDLRESGSLEQDADSVIFISGKKEASVREIVLAKQRNGPVGKVDLLFNGDRQRFQEIEIRG